MIDKLKKILEFFDYIGEREELLDKYLDEHDEALRLRHDKHKGVPSKPTVAKSVKRMNILLKEEADYWIDYIYGVLFTGAKPYIGYYVVDEICRKEQEPDYGFYIQVFYDWMHIGDENHVRLPTREEEQKRKTIKRTNIGLDKYSPKLRCVNCLRPIQYRYTNGNTIPNRNKETVCTCSGGKKAQAAMNALIQDIKTKREEKKKDDKRRDDKAERRRKELKRDGD